MDNIINTVLFLLSVCCLFLCIYFDLVVASAVWGVSLGLGLTNIIKMGK